MQLRKTPQNNLKVKKMQPQTIQSPVVNESKTGGWKNIFGVFSQFVAIGGDFV